MEDVLLMPRKGYYKAAFNLNMNDLKFSPFNHAMYFKLNQINPCIQNLKDSDKHQIYGSVCAFE
jgi:hypothetical protein